MKKSKKYEQYLKERESGFDLDFGVRAKLSEYNALHDDNMQHYFENPSLQVLLRRTGQVSSSGKIIDSDKHRSKLQIIENEFKRAEKFEHMIQKEELDVKSCVQKMKLSNVYSNKRQSKISRIKEDKKLWKEIVQTVKNDPFQQLSSSSNSLSRSFTGEESSNSFCEREQQSARF